MIDAATGTRDDLLRMEYEEALKDAKASPNRNHRKGCLRRAARVQRARAALARGRVRDARIAAAEGLEVRAEAAELTAESDEARKGNDVAQEDPDRGMGEALAKAAKGFMTKGEATFEEVVGQEEAVTTVTYSLLLALARREAGSPEVSPTRRILLYGPPGTGKTLIAAAASAELQAAFFNVDAGLERKYFGESPNLLKAVFKLASKTAPSVIFLDEIDHWGSTPSLSDGGHASLHNSLLTEIDGINSKAEQAPVFILGATNRPWALSPAILSRFGTRVHVGLPGRRNRQSMLHSLLEGAGHTVDVDPDWLLNKTEGFSGRDVRTLCDQAILEMVKEHNPLELARLNLEGMRNHLLKTGALTQSHFEKALARVSPPPRSEMHDRFEEWEERVGHTRGAAPGKRRA